MTRPLHLGRMARWQRWTTYVALAGCASTGLVWFLELDVWNATPPTARPWWIAHGVTAVIATLVIGGALAQHVVVAWRAARGRWTGAANVATLAVLLATALYLMYGAEMGHDFAHWVHAIVGIGAVLVFVGHVLWGRTRIPRIAHRSSHDATQRRGKTAER